MTFNLRRIAVTLAICTIAAVPAIAQAQGSMTWSGNVDDTAIISIQGRDVQTQTVSGNSVTNISTQFNGRLPHRPVYVTLRRYEGRGQVRIVQQPRPNNGFTIRVRIHDPQAGSRRYQFVLNWQR